MKSRRIIIVVSFFVMLVISACNGTASSITPSATLRGAIVPTRIPTETATATHTATHTATATHTNTPSPTATVTNTPTATATPTIDAAAVRDFIADGNRFIELGSLERAITAFDNALDLDSTVGDAYLGRGLANLQLNDLDSALGDFTQVIELDPGKVEAYFNRGLTYRQLDETEEAYADFQKVIELDPQNPDAYYQQALIHDNEGESDEAFTKINEAIRLRPAFADAFALRGKMYYEQNAYEAALADFEQYTNFAGVNASPETTDLLDDTRNQLATLTPQASPTEAIVPGTTQTPQVVEQPEVVAIAYGDSASGTITTDIYNFRYEFEASAGDLIDVQMTASSPLLDSLIIIENSNGDKIVENDDDPQGTGRDSFLRSFAIPEDGTYTIVATRFQQELGSTTGDFTMNLSLAEAAVETQSTDTPMLEYGDTVEGEITRDEGSVRYTFSAKAADVVGIRMKTLSASLDPLLILLDEGGNEIARNDDDEDGIGRDSYLRSFTIARDGVYTIVATRFQEDVGTTIGTFELLLEKVVEEA